jgi:uncharacterized protein YqeY
LIEVFLASFKEQLFLDLKTAMKNRDKVSVSTLRLLSSAITYAEKDKKEKLEEEEILNIVAKQAKQRKESIEAFKLGDRDDLVKQETAELEILESYLPTPFTDHEIKELISNVTKEINATDKSKMGAVMKKLMPVVRGRADGKKVSELVVSFLSEQQD